MSRLNDLIKFGVMLANAVLLVISVVIVIVGALIISGNWQDFDPDTFMTTAIYATAIGGILLFLTLVGCFGAVTQTEREGTCTGRRLLSTYQIFLIVLLVILICLGIEGKTTISSMEWTLDNRGSAAPEAYDKGDLLLAGKVNAQYFDNLCLEDPSSAWLINFVDKNCPSAMKYSSGGKCACDHQRDRCPDEDLCEQAMKNLKENDVFVEDDMKNCPYHKCRYQILAEVVDTVDPILDVIAIVLYVIGVMIFLTCLLICYNPHDDTKAQLIKTGVLVEVRKKKAPPPRGAPPPGQRRATHGRRQQERDHV
mmetsp:Transcript_18832/g.39193  ORF Transcript_18832/g.39193 Transcript_18832/m.39193 type:complete len:310 (-) Transcript_18832:66-995(-)